MTVHVAPRRLLARQEIENAIERLIALLDRIDGDPDFEDGDVDEPTLGWNATGDSGCMLSSLDGEFEDEGDGEPGEDEEPSLGWTVALDQSAPVRFGDLWGFDREGDGGERANRPVGCAFNVEQT